LEEEMSKQGVYKTNVTHNMLDSSSHCFTRIFSYYSYVIISDSGKGKKTMDEKHLISRAKTSSEAFGELYELHFERVYRYVAKRVSNREVAEDIVSDVWLKVLDKIDTYEDMGRPFASWLFSISANTVKDYYRRHRQVVNFEDVEEILYSEGKEEEILSRIHLDEAITNLTPSQQEVVLMRFEEDLKFQEIAASLGKSEGSVKALMVRALKALREYINKGGNKDVRCDSGYRGILA
jgi:RNA polymerase sigma-70 factor (ECF subfamily)